MITAAFSNLRRTVRPWLRSPASTAVMVLTLALGIGVTTALFSLVHRVVLDPLPFERPEQLVTLRSTVTGMGWTRIGVSEPLYIELAEQLGWENGVTAFQLLDANAGTNAQPVRIAGARASANLLDVLRARPALGRFFTPSEDTPGGPLVAVVSHGFWQLRLGGTPNVIGSTVRIDDVPHQVIGVLPRLFDFPAPETEVILPLRLPADARNNRVRRGSHNLTVLARLDDGVRFEQGLQDVAGFNAWLTREHGDFYLPRFGFSVEMTRLQDELTAHVRPSLLLLAGATGLVLLIACANVAHLLLSRSERRRRELAIRLAIGAGRRHVAGALLIDGAVIAVGSAVLGILFARLGLTVFIASFGEALPRAHAVTLNFATLLFALVATAGTALAIGLLPALRALRADAGTMLREESRGSSAAAGRTRMRAGLVIAETALAFLLMVSAGLLLRSLREILEVDPGFGSNGVVITEVAIPSTRYDTPERAAEFYADLTRRVAELPGIVAAGVTDLLPLRDEVAFAAFRPGTSFAGTSDADVAPSALRHVVGPGYIEAARIRLIHGRSLLDSDRRDGQRVVLVNESLARLHFPDADALGRQLVLFGEEPRTIVGVVGDVRTRSLTTQTEPELYAPLAQMGLARRNMILVVRASESTSLPAQIRSIVRSMDPAVATGEFQSMHDVVRVSLSAPRLLASLMGMFATLALVLGSVGVYAVLAYSFELRAREIAVRLALGATPANVSRLVLGTGVRLAALGIAIGALGTIGLSRVVRSVLYDVQPLDPAVLLIATLVLLGAAGAAGCAPALRARRQSPLESLRGE